MSKMTMPAGLYYVGDLCYVMNAEWDEVCALTIAGQNMVDGVFNLADGRQFAMFSTAYGDGTYTSNRGGKYPVDSGSIGCIMVDNITGAFSGESPDLGAGVLHKFERDFEVSGERGVIVFGHIVIDTDEDEEESLYDEDADEGEDD